MARINVEESIYKDPRFTELCINLGDRFKALGICVAIWSLAQRWYLKSPHGTIPISEWRKENIPDAVIKVGLAIQKPSGIYVSGSKKSFAWLLKCQEGGKISTRREIITENSQGNSSYPQGEPSSLFPTLSLRASNEAHTGDNLKIKNTNEKAEQNKSDKSNYLNNQRLDNNRDQEGTHPEPDALQPSPTFTGMVPKKKRLTSGGARVCADGRVFWRDFVSRVASVRGVDYSKHASGATGMKCKRITSIYSLEVLRSALESYVKDNDPFIEKAGWSLGVFISRLPVLVKKVEVNASTKSMYDLLNEASRDEQS